MADDPLGLGPKYLKDLETKAARETGEGIGGFLLRFANAYGTGKATPNLDRYITVQQAQDEAKRRREETEIHKANLLIQASKHNFEMEKHREGMLKETYENVLPVLQETLASVQDPEQRKALARKFVPQLKKATEYGSKSDPSVAAVGDDALYEHLLLNPGSQQSLLADMKWLTPEQRTALGREKDPGKRIKAAEELSDQKRRDKVLEAMEKIRAKAVAGEAPLNPEDAFKRAGLDQQHRAAISEEMLKTDPKRVATVFEQHNLLPPSSGQEKLVMTESIGNFLRADPEYAKLGVPVEKFGTLPPAVQQQFTKRALASQEERDLRKIEAERKASVSAAIEANMGALATPEERASLVDPVALQKGQIVQPPPGITVGALRKGAWVGFSPNQKQRFAELQPVRATMDTFDRLSGQIITARTASDAFKQGVRLSSSAFFRTNPLAKTYMDTLNANLTRMAKASGESGVLTNQDINRASGSFAGVFDTKEIRDLKHAIMRDIYDTTERALINEIAGTPAHGEARKRIDGLLDRLDAANAKATADAIGPGYTAYRNKKSGEIMRAPSDKPLTGKNADLWEALK